MGKRILVLYGSYRSDRKGIRLANFVVRRLRAQARDSEALLSDSRARESALLDALRALGAGPKVSMEQ
ncbi:MAG: hypothetical protein WBW93_18085 [Steroidobacteraceae bacterium]